VATEQEENWQDVKTPEWVAREMVQCIPDLKTRSRFLVLFNVELLEALVKEGVSLSKITFGSDSALEEAMAQGMYKRIKTFPIGRSFDEMKKALEGKAGQYDVVLSNPPYQIKDGGAKASARPIYHEIVKHVIDYLKPQFVCMITPSRWMVGGKGLDDYRARMLNDKRIQLIVDFPGTFDVFADIGGIAGGVSFFLWNRDRDPKEVLCSFNGIDRNIGDFDVLVRNNTSAQIIKKVLAKHTGTFCNAIVLPRKPFGLTTDFKGWVPEGTAGAVRCYIPKKDGLVKWIDSNVFTDSHGVLGKWKVYTPRAGWGGNAYKGGAQTVISQIFVGEKLSVCLETYLVAGSFNTKKEAENYAEYMRTKFYRFLLSLRTITQDTTRECFTWVPDLGNYANPVTDADLFAHFGLTKKEIDHINSTIKEI
jgi:site-specific DNA-methyltransferase (adenine-specific)